MISFLKFINTVSENKPQIAFGSLKDISEKVYLNYHEEFKVYKRMNPVKKIKTKNKIHYLELGTPPSHDPKFNAKISLNTLDLPYIEATAIKLVYELNPGIKHHEAAELLGISERTLYRKIDENQLKSKRN